MLITSLTSITLKAEFLVLQIPLLSYNPPDWGQLGPVFIKMEIVELFFDRLNVSNTRNLLTKN